MRQQAGALQRRLAEVKYAAAQVGGLHLEGRRERGQLGRRVQALQGWLAGAVHAATKVRGLASVVMVGQGLDSGLPCLHIAESEW